MIYELSEKKPRWIERGLAAADRAAATDPHLAEVLVARARLCYAQKKYDDAVRYGHMAIERKPDCEGAYNILGRAYFASGRYAEAVRLTDRALEMNGDDYNVYIPYALSLRKLGKGDAAKELDDRMMRVLEQQLELVPEDVEVSFTTKEGFAAAGDRVGVVALETALDDHLRELGFLRELHCCPNQFTARGGNEHGFQFCWLKHRRERLPLNQHMVGGPGVRSLSKPKSGACIRLRV